MHIDIKPIRLVTIIIERGRAKKLITLLNDNGYVFHDAYLGLGTARTGIGAYLGIGEEEKAVFMLYLGIERVTTLFDLLKREEYFEDYGGLAFTIPINSVSNLDILKLVNSGKKE